MQQALQLYPAENVEPHTAQSRQLRAMDSLNILAFRRGGAAPVPADHDDERSAVEGACLLVVRLLACVRGGARKRARVRVRVTGLCVDV